MDIKRKKNIVSLIGFIVGFAAGIMLHRHGLGVAFGILLALVFREVYDKRLY
ncbi:hypothetical protein [Mucilaginibacter sp. dw_454]|uniref:hypothetical protein n=1 Tax=Mucilaginibacter sp. dw_454 TaxID=2720079 RepID=UPI001BD62D1D|nr:hypothetical protein [Mucilaginibacter sp. dw_454]